MIVSQFHMCIKLFVFAGVKEFEARWIGWAGVNVPDEVGQKALTKALAEKVKSLLALHSFNIQNAHVRWRFVQIIQWEW